ncbi:MAG: hypothetical protein V5A66_00455 [Candidatus Thermoplasmatota archaeon]
MTLRTSEEIVEDREKGASELLEDVLESIQNMKEDEIIVYLKKLVRKRYSMTPLINLSNQIFLSIEEGKEVEQQILEMREKSVSKRTEAANKMKRLLDRKEHDKISTLSRSSTVLQSLSGVEKVVVLESRPRQEGRGTAERLNEKGIDVDYWVDAGMCKAMEGVDSVVIGADTISRKGFLNKIGSRALAVIAEMMGKEVFVVSDSLKILPARIPVPQGESHPPEEVWDTSKDINVKNDYFELTDLKRGKFVTEDGVKSSKKIKKIAEKKKVSERLLEIHPLIRER